MKLALIPAGEFDMGSPNHEVQRYDFEVPQHRVTITRPFYLGPYVVTQGEWKKVMGTAPWAGEEDVQEGSNYPATYVS